MVQKYFDSVQMAEQEAKVGLATLTRSNLRQLIDSGYRGDIWIGRPRLGDIDSTYYEFKGNRLTGRFFTGKKYLFGLLRGVEARDVTPEELPLEGFSYGRLAAIAANVEKAVSTRQ